jgi:hypothetical protein
MVPRALALVGAGELGAAEAAVEDRRFEGVAIGARRNVKLAVEGVQREDVAVRSVTGRRAGATVTGAPEVVPSLDGRLLALRQAARIRVDPPGEPMDEGPSRRVGVGEDER